MGDTIAIITARGGSKRIPKKNIKEFCGKPIIAYSIETALESKLFDEVMVSTDSEEIAEVAKKYGAVVPFYRSEKASDDFATTSEVLYEVLQEYENQGKQYGYACCIYPTAPFITTEKIVASMNLLIKNNADCVIPVVAYSYPPQRGLVITDSGKMELMYPQYIDTRSQDLQKVYHDCGQYYCFNVASFMRNKRLMVGKVMPYVVPEMEVQDIDNDSDWKIAEMKYLLMKENL